MYVIVVIGGLEIKGLIYSYLKLQKVFIFIRNL